MTRQEEIVQGIEQAYEMMSKEMSSIEIQIFAMGLMAKARGQELKFVDSSDRPEGL